MRNLSRAGLVFGLWVLAGLLVANFVSATEKIDINTAPLEDLVEIIHIGKVRAEELISLRPFSSLDDLTRIKGISKTRVEDIKKEGLAWVETEEQIEAKKKVENNLGKEEPKLITYPSGIILNEILPDPEGMRDAEGEYIEIFNKNKEKIDLSDWEIADTMGGSAKIYTFPENTTIEAEEFLVFYRKTTKIILNNDDGDRVNLIQPDGKIIDSVIYEKAPRGQSYNRTESGWVWSTTLTPGSVNIIPAPISETKKTETPKEEVKEPAPEKKTEESLVKKELAAIGEQIPKEGLSFYPFLIASAIAIFSGIIILTLKQKVKKFDFPKKLK